MADRRDDDFLTREGDRFQRGPRRYVAKRSLQVLGVALVLALVGGAIGWAGGWFSGAKEVVSFDNSKAQAIAVRGAWTGMQQAAENACDTEDAAAGGEGDPTLVERPDFAYRASYRRLAADYDRRMSNPFEASKIRRLAGISSLPDVAPSLAEMQSEVCRR